MKIIECPRDAMQGIKEWIPTSDKAAYINTLLKVGFDTIDFGSFVSPRAIPQMKDTAEVLGQLDLNASPTKLLAIIANIRGAEDAVKHAGITYLGYPFSISETFQQRNTRRSINEAYQDVSHIQDMCSKNDKQLVIYISMGFGNPYGDPWNADVAGHWIEKLQALGIRIFSLADTVGTAKTRDINYLFGNLIDEYPQVEFGAHFHTRPDNWKDKVAAAYNSGCKRFDSAMKGFGGCPMAKDELVGNLATEYLLSFASSGDVLIDLNPEWWDEAYRLAGDLFTKYS